MGGQKPLFRAQFHLEAPGQHPCTNYHILMLITHRGLMVGRLFRDLI